MDIGQIVTEIEDHVAPRLKLDVGEARLYYHLLRHSRFVGKHDVLISVAQLAEVLNCSKNTVKPRLRTLQDKKVIEVTNTGWAGTRIRVFLPREIRDAVPEETAPEVQDIEVVDFYKDPKYRPAILEREQGRCSSVGEHSPMKTQGSIMRSHRKPTVRTAIATWLRPATPATRPRATIPPRHLFANFTDGDSSARMNSKRAWRM